MNTKLKNTLVFFIFLLISTSVLARDWAKYTSDNFTIYSDERDTKVLNMINELEVFRIITLVQLGLPLNQPENSKLVIYLYAKRGEYRETGIDKNVIGFYINSANGPRMVIGPSKSTMGNSREILFHEYVHYLFFEHSDFNYPRWYSEGIAEVLSTAKVKFDSIIIGDVPAARRYTLNNGGLLDIENIVDLRNHIENTDRFESDFYASSWALVHYLQINSVFENPQLGQQTKNYLMLINKNEDPLEALEASFGMTLRQMNRELESYINKKSIPAVAWNLPEYLGLKEKSELSENEKNYMIADLLWQRGQEEEALDYLKNLEEHDAYYAKILSLKAILLNHNKSDNAKIIASDALQLGSNDSVVLSNLSHYEWDRYLASYEAGNPKDELLKQTKQYARDALALDEEDINAHSFLAEAMLAENNINEALSHLISISNINPTNSSVQLRIIRILIYKERADLAEPFARNLLSAVHDNKLRIQLTKLLEQIARGKVNYEDFNEL